MQINFQIITKQNNHPGYIALISVLIISAVLIVLAVSISTISYFSRFNVLDMEYKKRSNALAKGCLNITLFNLSKDINYMSTESIGVNSESCKIFSVRHDAPVVGHITIQTKATVQNAVTNLQIIVDENLNLISWEELPNL